MDIASWLLSPESRHLTFESLIQASIDRLVAQGVPLWRLSTSLQTFHPEVFVHNLKWVRGRGLESVLLPRELIQKPEYQGSPILYMYQHDLPEMHFDLTQPAAELPFEVCRELAEQGGTDYLLLGLEYSDGQRSFVSFCSDAPGGFSDSDLKCLRSLVPVLSMRNEIAARRFATDCLMRVYLGSNAAARVLGGQFMRGQSDSLKAVIWFSDMRDFTLLSTRVSDRRLVEILDLYFDAMVGPIHAHGGEVLKFIGDAVLAVFPTEEYPQIAAHAAYEAAQEALEAVAKLRIPEAVNLKAGIALHLGELTFGNVGATGRIDFTIIGAQVNEASRIEGLCKVLVEPLIMSQSFVNACEGKAFRPLGEHHLRGVAQAMPLYGPLNKITD